MIKILDKSKCCGCEACIQICPQHCISPVSDNEGFLYPEVDQSKCIKCGKCVKVCYMLNPCSARCSRSVYAAKNKDEQVRAESSSGGVFSALASSVFKQNGVVVGACFNEQFEVIHQIITAKEQINALRGSKYVQSRIGDVFNQVKLYLHQDRLVLFSGTPCQIAGLKFFLQREYDNLLLTDVACHGVPSPGVWKQYLKEVCQNYYANELSVNFRDKVTGWKNYSIVIHNDKRQVLINQTHRRNLYMKGFLGNFTLRPSCYSCYAKGGRSGSDLTLADYWGVGQGLADFDDDRGVSLVVAYTSKGEDAIKGLDLDIRRSSYEDALRNNSALESAVKIPSQRARFFKLASSSSVIDSLSKVTHRPLCRRLFNRGFRILSRLFRR